ncbi:uncharacterized protein IL334_007916 [Kwoniella shivajii]|uniref:Uncharacterized protein n=1 Tax=Kwoniella shivajii TaxID=564305 RepID=A0ABZ1DDW5_9TREE|nr:hypothetical protein IL334_007916 [Kwoniella shivajii]
MPNRSSSNSSGATINYQGTNHSVVRGHILLDNRWVPISSLPQTNVNDAAPGYASTTATASPGRGQSGQGHNPYSPRQSLSPYPHGTQAYNTPSPGSPGASTAYGVQSPGRHSRGHSRASSGSVNSTIDPGRRIEWHTTRQNNGTHRLTITLIPAETGRAGMDFHLYPHAFPDPREYTRGVDWATARLRDSGYDGTNYTTVEDAMNTVVQPADGYGVHVMASVRAALALYWDATQEED